MRDLEEWETDPNRIEAIRMLANKAKRRRLEKQGVKYEDAYHTVGTADVLAVLEAAAGFEAQEG